MIRLVDWSVPRGTKKPALVIGKGPTAEHLNKVDFDKYTVFTLNHAIRAVPVCFGAHFIDIEAYRECFLDVDAKAEFLFMPDRPHEFMTQGREIWYYADLQPSLKNFDRVGHLITYTKSPVPVERCKKDMVSCLYFSAEAMFGVLGLLHFKEVYTIGIDGGATYAKQFTMKPLTNGRPSFDIQMEQLRKIAKIRNFTWTRLFSEPSGK